MAIATQPQTCIDCGHRAPGMIGYEVIPLGSLWYSANWRCPDSERIACEQRQAQQQAENLRLRLDV
jgi:hypothetical protein